jgi:hypothetical protein
LSSSSRYFPYFFYLVQLHRVLTNLVSPWRESALNSTFSFVLLIADR